MTVNDTGKVYVWIPRGTDVIVCPCIIHIQIIWLIMKYFPSYIVLVQIRQCSLLEPGFPGIIKRLHLRLPMNLFEPDFLRDA